MEDKTLKLLHKSDPPTQKRVYYQHCDRLMAVVYQYLGSVADAEEVLQDTFLTIFEKIDKFDPKRGTFYAWTHRIAINKSLMFLRKKKQMRFSSEDLTNPSISNHLTTSPQQMEQADLEYYISKLPNKAAVVFRLKAVEGYNHEEIAKLLGIRSDASRAIFSRARKRLQNYFSGLKPSSSTVNQKT